MRASDSCTHTFVDSDTLFPSSLPRKVNSQPFGRFNTYDTKEYQRIPDNTRYPECPAVNNAEVGISRNAKSLACRVQTLPVLP